MGIVAVKRCRVITNKIRNGNFINSVMQQQEDNRVPKCVRIDVREHRVNLLPFLCQVGKVLSNGIGVDDATAFSAENIRSYDW